MHRTSTSDESSGAGGFVRAAAAALALTLGTMVPAACSFGDDGPTTADRPTDATPEVLERTVTANDPSGAPTPTAVPIVIEGTNPGNVYIVQPNDLLGTIANELGVTPEALSEANGITDPNLLVVGQELIIPEAETDPEENP